MSDALSLQCDLRHALSFGLNRLLRDHPIRDDVGVNVVL